MNKLICVIGAGYWGKNHIRTLNELDMLGGVVEQNTKILKNICSQYPSAMTYSNISDALSNKDFQGYIIATPADTHFTIAEKIIKSQKHVLIEKPFTLNIRDAEEIVRLSLKYSVNTMVGHLLLFHPAIQKIKEMVNNGKIGDLQYIYSNRLNLGQVRTKENVFWSFAPHDIAIFQYLTDSYPKKVHSKGSSFLQGGIYDSTITQIKYPNNIDGHIFVSWLHPFKEHRLVVIGSESMISFEDSLEQKPLQLYSKKIVIENGFPEKIEGPTEEIIYEKKMPLKEELVYFYNHLDGSPIKIADSKHALDVTRILVEASNKLEV